MSQLIKPFAVIVPAAGRGLRFNQEVPKQYTLLDGMSILELSLDPIIRFSECLGICLVISREDSQWESLSFEGLELNCIEGGEERFLSVLNGINFWQNSSKTFDFILIHDAVRPCIRKSEIESLFKTLEDTSIDGAVLGTPCRETMKEVSSADNIVKRTVDRRSLWTAFTPQVFRKEALFSAFNNLEDKSVDFSDEASFIEANQGKIKVIEGSRENIKVTLPEDLNIAKSILISQGRISG